MKCNTLISLAGFMALLSLSAPAHAYLDPATGSIILQATIGIIASATLFFRVSLDKIKNFFSRTNKAGTEQE